MLIYYISLSVLNSLVTSIIPGSLLLCNYLDFFIVFHLSLLYSELYCEATVFYLTLFYSEQYR